MHLVYTEIMYPFHGGMTDQFLLILSISNPSLYLEMLSSIQHLNSLEFYHSIRQTEEYNQHREITFHLRHLSKQLKHVTTERNVEKCLAITWTPQIAQIIELPTLERICILKTFWLRILQRRWKKIVAYNQLVWKHRMSIARLRKREFTGSFSLPLLTLRGCLSDLNA